MYYSYKYQTNWHDTDPYGYLRPTRILTYMQETGNRQCRAYGMDLDTLFRRERKGFLLSRLRMWLNAPLHAYEELEVQTWCPPSRGLTFLRCFRLLRDGVTVGEASSTWAFMDANTKSLVKVSDVHADFPTGDPVDEAPLPKPVRLSASLPMETVGQRQIMYSDVDFNGHMNNTRYPDMVCDFLPPEAMEGKWLRQMSLSYMREAALGDTLSVSRLPVPDREGAFWLRASGADGSVCFEAEMDFAGE